MKIALVLDDSLDRPDGVQQYVLTLGRHLAGQGHEVHYLCSTAGRDDLPNLHSLARNVGVTFNGNGLRVPRPASRRMLRRFLAEQRFDVVHVQTPHSPLFAARVVDAARRVQGSGVTVVGTFHILPHSRLSALATRALGMLLRRNLRRFDRLCAVSPPAAAFARRAFRVDARVIPIPLDVDAIASAVRRPRPAPRPGGTRVVAFLGRMVERKGVVELVEALALLPGSLRARLDVRLGGKGPLADDVRRRVERHGLAGVVTMAGFVSEDDKPQFFADADLVALPATGGESFGIVLIEAMAAGAGAVLGGANPGYLSVLGEDPLVSVDPRDTPAFAARLEQLLTDDALRARIGSDQARQVRQYRVQAVGRLIEDFYTEGFSAGV